MAGAASNYFENLVAKARRWCCGFALIRWTSVKRAEGFYINRHCVIRSESLNVASALFPRNIRANGVRGDYRALPLGRVVGISS